MTATVSSAPLTIKAPPLETAKDVWIALTFALKTFVAGLFALYLAFSLGLDEPRSTVAQSNSVRAE
jgi:hypothetical protein